MEDLYYSKKLDQHFPTRLDVLLYAHDGRGLGHASRTIGIGMALRRLYPKLRILFVTGANISQSLIGNSKLDWIKLPSYASHIVDGVSSGVDGPANFYKSVLGKHRSGMLAEIIDSFKPRVVLADHSPIGKRKELLEALEASKDFDTKWILGLRAVIGTQKSFWSDEFRDTFQKYYDSIIWYGDSGVLGQNIPKKIETHFGAKPVEMGYVSRLFETKKLVENTGQKITGTISIPWLGAHSHGFLKILRDALLKRSQDEKWQLFINKNEVMNTRQLFSALPHCEIEPVGETYSDAILNSKVAIIYGGYNSLMDIFAAQTPAIVIMRDMKDQEQKLHINQLLEHNPEKIIMVEEESTDMVTLELSLKKLLTLPTSSSTINIDGSEKSARFLQQKAEN